MPTSAAGNGFTVIIAEFAFVQPVDMIVSVRAYVVVAVGLTAGFAEVDVNPDGLLAQLYVWPPAGLAPIDTVSPLQMDALDPGLAAGIGFTVTTTRFVLVHPVAVIVSIRV